MLALKRYRFWKVSDFRLRDTDVSSNFRGTSIPVLPTELDMVVSAWMVNLDWGHCTGDWSWINTIRKEMGQWSNQDWKINTNLIQVNKGNDCPHINQGQGTQEPLSLYVIFFSRHFTVYPFPYLWIDLEFLWKKWYFYFRHTFISYSLLDVLARL